MDGAELARLIGPTLTMAARAKLAPLARGATADVFLLYDDVKDWKTLGGIFIDNREHVHLYDSGVGVCIELESAVL